VLARELGTRAPVRLIKQSRVDIGGDTGDRTPARVGDPGPRQIRYPVLSMASIAVNSGSAAKAAVPYALSTCVNYGPVPS